MNKLLEFDVQVSFIFICSVFDDYVISMMIEESAKTSTLDIHKSSAFYTQLLMGMSNITYYDNVVTIPVVPILKDHIVTVYMCCNYDEQIISHILENPDFLISSQYNYTIKISSHALSRIFEEEDLFHVYYYCISYNSQYYSFKNNKTNSKVVAFGSYEILLYCKRILIRVRKDIRDCESNSYKLSLV